MGVDAMGVDVMGVVVMGVGVMGIHGQSIEILLNAQEKSTSTIAKLWY